MSKRFVSLITLVAMLLCLMAPATAMAQATSSTSAPSITNVTDTSATISVPYTVGASETVEFISVYYSTTPDMSSITGFRIATADTSNPLTGGTVSATISSLSADTTYYFKSLCSVGGNVIIDDSVVSATTKVAYGQDPTVDGAVSSSVSGGKVTFSLPVKDGNPVTITGVTFTYTVNGLNMYSVSGTKSGNTWSGSMNIGKMTPGTYEFKAIANYSDGRTPAQIATGSFTITQDQIDEKPETIIPGVVVPGNGYYYNGYYYVPGYGYYIPGYGYVPNYPTTYYSYVITNNPTNISSANATLNGFASNGISKAGFQIRKANGNWGDTLWGSDANGAYALKVTGLKPGTAYYVRAVGIAGNGYVYGDPVAFVTTGGYVSNPAPVVPSVPTYPSYPNYTVPGGSLPGSSSGNSIPKTGVDAHYYAAAVLMMAGLALVATAKRREA